MAIQGFLDERCRAIFNGADPGKRFPASILRVVRRKLDILDAASQLGDLRAPPNNHLEALTGDRMGQYSIRVNDQFRLCFRWTTSGPVDVEFVDYH